MCTKDVRRELLARRRWITSESSTFAWRRRCTTPERPSTVSSSSTLSRISNYEVFFFFSLFLSLSSFQHLPIIYRVPIDGNTSVPLIDRGWVISRICQVLFPLPVHNLSIAVRFYLIHCPYVMQFAHNSRCYAQDLALIIITDCATIVMIFILSFILIVNVKKCWTLKRFDLLNQRSLWLSQYSRQETFLKMISDEASREKKNCRKIFNRR